MMTAEKNPILRRKSMELLKDLVFENCFMVREIRVIKGPTGLFVSMPAKKQTDGTHR
jgi:DNA-binding cell septation regulator SpoVG